MTATGALFAHSCELILISMNDALRGTGFSLYCWDKNSLLRCKAICQSAAPSKLSTQDAVTITRSVFVI